MSIDTQIDLPIAAIASLARGAIRADLGDDVLVKVFKDPRNLFTIAAVDLPALCVHRASERPVRRTSTQLVDEVVVAFEYALPSTSVDGRDARWPTLPAVWHSLSRAVLKGKHPAVNGGAEVLRTVDTWANEDSARVLQYTLAEGGRDTEPEQRPRHPIFFAQISVTVAPEVDASTLNDFLRFHMSFDEPSGDHTEPLIEFNITLPAYGS